MSAIEEMAAAGKMSRRSLLTKFGAAGVGVAATALLAGCGGSSSSGGGGGGISQTDVLNFALNLEYLEANFYAAALTGNTLTQAQNGGVHAGAITGATKVTGLNSTQTAVLTEIASDEAKHVADLQGALGNNFVPCPALDLTALGAYDTMDAFLLTAKAFEDVGVTAYAGAATLLTGQNLQYAADILAVEAFHSANLRLLIQIAGLTTTPVDPNAPGGSKDTVTTPSGPFWATDANGIAYNRNPSEVLSIVFGLQGTLTVGTKTGGFFPNGLNGNITTITTATPDAL